MGLCKCPKKKVTNQFCFEHRVNVCEHCIVADHTKCIVQSYLQWLNDSEYNPTCGLCKNPLEDQDCTRLVCYDLFHSSCLASWGESHPSHTAPAGFKCPVCGAAVFPAPQLASPVALALKQTLSTWDWARKAMGLSSESSSNTWSSTNGVVTEMQNGSGVAATTTANSTALATSIPTHSFTSSSASAKASQSATSKAPTNTAAVPASASVGVASSTHRKTSSSDSHSLNVMEESDTDDNKYKRRPVLTWFKRWWRSYQPLGSGGGRAGGRRRCLVLLVILLITTVLLLLARTRSSSSSEGRLDPVFDPLNNPNIHVQEAE